MSSALMEAKLTDRTQLLYIPLNKNKKTRIQEEVSKWLSIKNQNNVQMKFESLSTLILSCDGMHAGTNSDILLVSRWKNIIITKVLAS